MASFGELFDHAAQYVGSGDMVKDMGRDLQNAANYVNNLVGGSGSPGQNQADFESNLVKVTPFMSIMSIKPKDGWVQKTSPIHEIRTLAALAHSDAYPPWILRGSGTISEEAKTDLREYLRGAIWNDDPLSHLFHDNPGWNFDRKKGLAVSYGADYLGATQAYNIVTDRSIRAAMPSLTQRAHEGDMQFLHCMAQEKGETVQETVRKVMCWCEAMYNIAIGQFDESRQLASIKLPWFTQFTTPCGTDTVRTLFAGNTPSYPKIQARKRALGSIFHIIQDSYAAGYCRRNPPFKGPIEQCHTFTGQVHEKHSDLDHSFKNIEDISLGDLDSFVSWHGVRPGIDACIKLANLWGEGRQFDDGVRGLLRDEVFAIASHAKAADSSI